MKLAYNMAKKKANSRVTKAKSEELIRLGKELESVAEEVLVIPIYKIVCSVERSLCELNTIVLS